MDKIKIVMLKDDRGAPFGHTVLPYADGKEYEVPRELADIFIKAKSAKVAAPGPGLDIADLDKLTRKQLETIAGRELIDVSTAADVAEIAAAIRMERTKRAVREALRIVEIADGAFNVVDANGKPLNPEPLTREDADRLIADPPVTL